MRIVGVVLLSLAGAQAGVAASPAHAATPQRYVVVVNQQNGLPSSAERAIADAGGTITARLAEIGAVGVTSSNPNFVVDVQRNPVVRAASPDAQLVRIPEQGAVGMDADASRMDNNGGTVTPPGPDPQPMPDSLGHQQWDKMRMNTTLTGTYAI
jgi:hypothetical protein